MVVVEEIHYHHLPIEGVLGVGVTFEKSLVELLHSYM